MKLGIAGHLTRTFINSPLTPLLLLAALVAGAIALVSLPREEEPQISVPMVDIIVPADGYKADQAVELVTRPLEDIVKGIDGVEHVYSTTEDDHAVVTARFLVGTDQDVAVMRVHEKIRANIGDLPKGIPEPLIVGRGINDVAIVTLSVVGPAGQGRTLDRQRPFPGGGGASARTVESRQYRLHLYRRRQPEPDPRRARSREARRLWGDAQSAHRQAVQRQPLVPGRRVPRRRQVASRSRRADTAGRA